MKNFSLILIAFVLILTFTATDVVEKGNKPGQAKKCPYIESLRQNDVQQECPFLKGLTEGNLCPYINRNNDSQTGCPFLDGGSSLNKCPYLQQQSREKVNQSETHPLPEGKNT